jgi:hypothetical protein
VLVKTSPAVEARLIRCISTKGLTDDSRSGYRRISRRRHLFVPTTGSGWTADRRGSVRLAGDGEGGFACTVGDSRSTRAPGPFEPT